MAPSRSESPSTSTSKRLRRSSTPDSAIGSRTRTRGRSGIGTAGRDGRERLERAGDAHAALQLGAGLHKCELDGRERGDDVEDVVVADVADAEQPVLQVAVAAGDGDAVPVAEREPQLTRVDALGGEDRGDDGRTVLIR